jgi:hypothetical protein
MNDILSLFQNVPNKSILTLFFDYTFKLEESPIKQAFNAVSKVIQRAWAPSENKDDKSEKKVEEIKDEMLFSLSYSLISNDSGTVEAVKSNLLSAFAPFITKGLPEFKSKRIWHHCRFSEVVNLFHIPTKVNFVK